MRLLLSGEGPSDMGSCAVPDPCSGVDFHAGPMAWVVDQIAAARLEYSSMELGLVAFVSEQIVTKRSKALGGLRLAGKKRPKETAYFFRNARALAQLAGEFAEQAGDTVVAVLFHDSDGTHSSGRGLWQSQWDSMLEGFRVESYQCGVPMIPKPKSEAWLLCALKSPPYQHCGNLEQGPRNDASPNSLKKQLEVVVGEPATRDLLVEKVVEGEIDALRLTGMPSFQAFKDRLESVLNHVLEGQTCVS